MLLAELALDMRWSWNHATDEVWRQLDPDLWEITHNPWVVLQTVSAGPDRARVGRSRLPQERGWAGRSQPAGGASARVVSAESRAGSTDLGRVFQHGVHVERSSAYLFGRAVAMWQATNSRPPAIWVCRWSAWDCSTSRAIFARRSTRTESNRPSSRITIPDSCRSRRCASPNGEWLRLEIALPGYSVWLRAWQVQVGRVKLYLLDSNDAANFPAHRGITSELYGGGPELRLKQEMLLGIGGWRLLRALGVQPEVCHLNEGHAAFAVLERARDFMEETGQPFEVALAVTRAGNLFTTHTAVAAGFDRFDPALIEQYLGGYAEKKLGIALQDLLALGRQNPTDSSEPFQHGVSGNPRERGREWGEPLAREGEPAPLSASVSALAGGRGPDRTRDQRSPHAHLGLGPCRRSLDGKLWKGPLAGDDGDPGTGHSPGLRRQAVAISDRRQ